MRSVLEKFLRDMSIDSETDIIEEANRVYVDFGYDAFHYVLTGIQGNLRYFSNVAEYRADRIDVVLRMFVNHVWASLTIRISSVALGTRIEVFMNSYDAVVGSGVVLPVDSIKTKSSLE